MSDIRHDHGAAGEKLAEKFLRAGGFKFVARHYVTPVGELDLVMRDGAAVVFVEVKTRGDRRLAEPHEAMTRAKRRRLLRAAQWYLHAKRWEDLPCRFDVVAVILLPDADPQIEHFIDAFTPADA